MTETKSVDMKKHRTLENEWFYEIFRGRVSELFVKVMNDQASAKGDGWESTKVYKIFTRFHSYHIVAKDNSNDEGYLGCTSSQRMPLAGEDWTRGRDLPDGKFVKETWDNIVRGILMHELVMLAPKRETKVVVDGKGWETGQALQTS